MKIDLRNLPSHVAPAFWPCMVDRSRYLVMWGGAGSSKSITAGTKLIARCLAAPGHKFVCARKFSTDVRGSVFAQLQGQLSRLNLGGIVDVYRHEMMIEFRNGSRIHCRGLDDPEKLKSVPDVTGFWLEEATELEMEDFLQADLRLRGATVGYKQIILTFNPVLRTNWVHEAFFVDQPERRVEDGGRVIRYLHGGRTPAMVHHSTYRDNPWLDADYRAVLESLADSSENHYRVYHDGEWGQASGTVYHAFSRALHVTPIAEFDPALPVLWTHDFNIGVGKPMSSALCQIKRGKDASGRVRQELHIFDEIILDGADTNIAIREYIERGWAPPGQTTIYGDASGRAGNSTNRSMTDFLLLQQAGFVRQNVPPRNPPVGDRHNAVNALLKSAGGDVRLFIHPRCQTVAEGLETVALKPGGQYVEVETRAQHVTTAVGYLVYQEFPLISPKAQGQAARVILA